MSFKVNLHTSIYIHIYIYVCTCVYIYICTYLKTQCDLGYCLRGNSITGGFTIKQGGACSSLYFPCSLPRDRQKWAADYKKALGSYRNNHDVGDPHLPCKASGLRKEYLKLRYTRVYAQKQMVVKIARFYMKMPDSKTQV